MKFKLIILTLTAFLFYSCTDRADEEVRSYINSQDLSPPDTSTVDGTEEIDAQLEYYVGDSDLSDEGYVIGIQFESTTEGQTFAKGIEANIPIMDTEGGVTLVYPLTNVWADDRLPPDVIRFKFQLRRLLRSSSVVIAQTETTTYYR